MRNNRITIITINTIITGITIMTLFLFTESATAAEKIDLSKETSRISYSLGYQIGGDFKRQGVDMDASAVVQGIEDAISGSDPLLPAEQMISLLVALKQKVVAVQAREIIRNTTEFMAANLRKPGVKELPNGSQYRILANGSGPSPTLEDTVDIHYITKRTDDSVIASTYSEGTPRAYQVKATLPGLQEALQMMSPGSRWELFLPPGKGGRNETMNSDGVLIYELELVAIHPAAGKAG